MADCDHGLDDRWCHTCINGVAHDQAQYISKPEKPSKPRLKLDPFERLVEEYASGARCTECDQLTHRGLCACDREERFELLADVLHEWSRQAPGKPRERQGLKFIAHGALGREITRAGFGDELESDMMPGVTRREALMALDRVGGIDGASGEIEPKWRPFTNTKADPLPLPA